MATAEYDLRYIREALKILEGYLLSKEIYWSFPVNPPPGEAAYPALTLGGILLCAARLSAQRDGGFLLPAQSVEWHELNAQVDVQRTHWHTAWSQKAERSFQARLTQWSNFLEDYQQEPESHAQRYAYEVRLRVMLDLLAAATAQLSTAQQNQLRSLDLILHHSLQPGAFVWDEQLLAGFPKSRFWYLYGKLLTESLQDA